MGIEKIPAYGFLSSKHPMEPHVRQAEKMHEKNKQLRSKFKRALERFDLDEKVDVPKATSKKKFAKKLVYMSNAGKILGYFPIIGNLVGVGRLVSLALKSNRKDHSVHNVERGLLEVTGLGIINLPIDLWATFARKDQDKKNSGASKDEN